ncbi:hypothetical protein IB234_15340 [Pseudomonas sp. PDM16]|uniref:hypothetical protein n=1 Tax=Pseudomonas sp. PDM16 TaxID=2769292 RepID=UPI00177CB8BE|nr:hypothetical protein [Pseudomonas sp. PDM16]MBD9415936.1 hypothetical protein [Pseudomonas sp. PDM16]
MSGGGGGDNKVKDTPEQKMAAQVAAEKWNFAQQQLAPLEDVYMKRVEDMDSAGRMSYLAGRVNQETMAEQSELGQQVGLQLGQAGVDPSSGRYQGTMGDLTQSVAQGGGETLGRAQFEQTSQKVQGLQNIMAMGAGESTKAQAGLSDLASTAAADARSNSVTSFNRKQANLQLLGAAAGAATNYGLGQMKASTPAAPNMQGQSQGLYNNSAFVRNM